MRIEGCFKFRTKAYKGLKILLSGRELNEQGQPKYPYIFPAGVAGRNYYVALPGRKLDKINEIIEYTPSDYGIDYIGLNVNWNVRNWRFTSLTPDPRDWEFDISFMKNEYTIVNEPYPHIEYTLYSPPGIPYPTGIPLEIILAHSTGKRGNWGERKPIDPNIVGYNPYIDMFPLGKGYFAGVGYLPYTLWDKLGSNTINPSFDYFPFVFYDLKDANLFVNNAYRNELISKSESDGIFTQNNLNTKCFYLNENDIYGVEDRFPRRGLNSTPRNYRISESATLTGESYSLSASSSSVIVSGSWEFTEYNCVASFKNINTVSGLRNDFYALVFEVEMSPFSTSASRSDYETEFTTKVFKVDLVTGSKTEICSYTSTLRHDARIRFEAGFADLFIFRDSPIFNADSYGGYTDAFGHTCLDTITSNIDIDILPQFIEAIVWNKSNSVFADNKIYAIKNADSEINNKILASDYQLTLRTFDLNDLSSYQETTLTVEKSEQPSIPISDINVMAFQYHPEF